MSDELTQEQIDAISNALASGKKITAIKLYREASGKGLKEAKDFIEALIPKLKEKDPEKYAKISEPGAGCAATVLLFLGLTTVGLAWAVHLLA